MIVETKRFYIMKLFWKLKQTKLRRRTLQVCRCVHVNWIRFSWIMNANSRSKELLLMKSLYEWRKFLARELFESKLITWIAAFGSPSTRDEPNTWISLFFKKKNAATFKIILWGEHLLWRFLTTKLNISFMSFSLSFFAKHFLFRC